MPSVAMCLDRSCPKRMDCYRYRAIKALFAQTYFQHPPRDGDQCSEFLEINGRMIVSEREADER